MCFHPDSCSIHPCFTTKHNLRHCSLPVRAPNAAHRRETPRTDTAPPVPLDQQLLHRLRARAHPAARMATAPRAETPGGVYGGGQFTRESRGGALCGGSEENDRLRSLGSLLGSLRGCLLSWVLGSVLSSLPNSLPTVSHSCPVIPHLFPDIIHHSAANAHNSPTNAHHFPSNAQYSSLLAYRLSSRLSSRLASRLGSRLPSRLASHSTHPNLHQITQQHFLLASVLTPTNK